jgi:hypothetical protein
MEHIERHRMEHIERHQVPNWQRRFKFTRSIPVCIQARLDAHDLAILLPAFLAAVRDSTSASFFLRKSLVACSSSSSSSSR